MARLSKRMPVGIDDLSIYVPRLFLPTTGEFALSRGIDPRKLIRGIGIERMAIPDAHQDAATMAAMSILGLMERNDLLPQEISRIYVGTESGVDEAKAMGSYIIGMLEQIFGLGSFQGCSTVELKSACIGATIALENLCCWAAQDEGRAGIAVATDIARYPLRSPGEYTQGAGSIALLVKANPRLLALEDVWGTFARDEDDFFRPLGESTAVVNGKHSNLCYLEAMEMAFLSYRKRMLEQGILSPKRGECLTDHLSHLLFHIPFPRMVEYASAAILRRDWMDLPRWREIEEELGVEPDPRDFHDEESYLAERSKHEKSFSQTEMFQRAYQSKAYGTTLISREVGNIYTGSLYLGLLSLMEKRMLKSGERLCFGSYGSGCSALVFSGIVQSDDHPVSGILKELEERREISLQEYEALHRGEAEKSILAPEDEFALAGVDSRGYRRYEFVC
jgi:hydroxymethylglutaryl-CoA synthase